MKLGRLLQGKLGSQAMNDSVKITLIVTSAVVLLGLIGFYLYNQSLPGNTITSNGNAEISAIPDLVSVNFRIETLEDSATESKDANAEIVENLRTALIKEGFENKDITTSNFNVREEYEWSKNGRNFIGYKTSHSIRVEFSTGDTDKIGEAIDAGVEAGANIGYINFEISQELQNTYKAEALELATEDATLKAGAIAKGLGKNLGRIVSVQTSEFDYSPWRYYDGNSGTIAEAQEAATNIQPEEKDITAHVSVIYKIA